MAEASRRALDVDAEAALFAALGDPTRLRLVERLGGGGARPIRLLAEGLPLSRQAVTKHLAVLEEAGLVESRREGRETLFSPRPEALGHARARIEALSRLWDERLARLRRLVED